MTFGQLWDNFETTCPVQTGLYWRLLCYQQKHQDKTTPLALATLLSETATRDRRRRMFEISQSCPSPCSPPALTL